MNRKILLLLAVLVGGFAFYLLLPGDEEKIRDLFEELTTLVSAPKTNEAIGKLQRVNSFREIFAETILFESPDLPVKGEISNEELTRLFFTVAERSKYVSLGHEELLFSLLEESRAEVLTHFHGEALLLDDRLFESSSSVKAVLIKIEGDWKFTEFQTAQDADTGLQ